MPGARGEGRSGKRLNASEYLAWLIKSKDLHEASVSIKGPDGKLPTFASMEARCEACSMFRPARDAYAQPPCITVRQLELIQQQTGRRCPRVMLDVDNTETVHLAMTMLSEASRPFARDEWRDLTRYMPAADARRIRQRAIAAVNSAQVSEAMYPRKREEDERRR